jgi:HAMP domain-containing protein
MGAHCDACRVSGKLSPVRLPHREDMTLLLRINLALGTAFVLAALLLVYVCSRLLETNAQQELLREAGLMMDSAVATFAYTSEEILPLLQEPMQSTFLPQSVPFYATTQNFLKLHTQHPEYSFKEATLNPTNPRDRAMDWEADLIQQFRNSTEAHEIVGERDTPLGRSLYLARPIRVAAECLACHGSASAAPATLRARYGSNNGFGWQPDEVVGARVISVPLAAAEGDAHRALHGIVIAIAAVFSLLLLLANALVYGLTVRPLRRISRIADALSRGESPAENFPGRGSTEITALGRAFERMRISLEKALKLLER